MNLFFPTPLPLSLWASGGGGLRSVWTSCCFSLWAFLLQQQQFQAQHLSHAPHGPQVQLPPHPSGLPPPGIPPVTGSSSGLLALGTLGSQAHLAVKDEKHQHDLDHRGEDMQAVFFLDPSACRPLAFVSLEALEHSGRGGLSISQFPPPQSTSQASGKLPTSSVNVALASPTSPRCVQSCCVAACLPSPWCSSPLFCLGPGCFFRTKAKPERPTLED